MAFSLVPLYLDHRQLSPPPSPDHEVVTTAPTKGVLQILKGIVNDSLIPLFHPNHVCCCYFSLFLLMINPIALFHYFPTRESKLMFAYTNAQLGTALVKYK